MRFLIKDTETIKKAEKLSLRDKKLIQLLINDGRMSVSEIAKKLKVSKPGITQKIASLTKKGILINPVTYARVSATKEKLSVLHLKTSIGTDTKEITAKLLKIPSVSAVLWYIGSFNLLIAIQGEAQETLESISKVIPIQKHRLLPITNNYFHHPHFFNEIKEKKYPIKENNLSLNSLDKKLIKELYDNPRSSILDLSEKCRSSPITIKKHLNELEINNIIIGFSYYVNLWMCGKDLVSVNFSVIGRKETNNLITEILKIPQSGNAWEFDHEWNINAVFYVDTQRQANNIIETLRKNNPEIKDLEVSILSKMVGK